MPISGPKKTPTTLKIAQAYQGFLDEPVPSILFDAVVSGKANRILNTIKLGLFILAGYLAAVLIEKIDTNEPALFDPKINIEQLAVSSHTTFANDAVYPVRVGSDDIDHLSRWLAYRSDMQISIPQLSTLGFSLLGGNTIPDSGNISAMLVYENVQGSKLSVLYRNTLFENNTEPSNSGKLDNYHWHSFHSQPLGNQQLKIVIVSELDQNELQRVSTFMQ